MRPLISALFLLLLTSPLNAQKEDIVAFHLDFTDAATTTTQVRPGIAAVLADKPKDRVKVFRHASTSVAYTASENLRVTPLGLAPVETRVNDNYWIRSEPIPIGNADVCVEKLAVKLVLAGERVYLNKSRPRVYLSYSNDGRAWSTWSFVELAPTTSDPSRLEFLAIIYPPASTTIREMQSGAELSPAEEACTDQIRFLRVLLDGQITNEFALSGLDLETAWIQTRPVAGEQSLEE